MAEKEVTMKLKVDVHCEKCMKQVKKVLSKIPEIRDEVIDEKQNLVIIKVVCFDPEKIRDKICCKSKCSVKTIEILENTKPPNGPSCKPQKDKGCPDKEPDPKPKKCTDKEDNKPRCQDAECRPPDKTCRARTPDPPPVIGCPSQLVVVPIRTCCVPWSKCRPGGPCLCFHNQCGRPSACYCGCNRWRSGCDSYCGGKACSVSPCEQSASECTTM